MRLFVPILMVFVNLSSCGAKTGLDGEHDLDDSLDSGTHDAEPPGPSCRNLPNCIEAEITMRSGETIAFAREGEVHVAMYMGRGAWLETPEGDDLAMAVQVSLDAAPGPVVLSLNPVDFYVDLRFPDAHCNIHGEGSLERVDLTSGGVIEGTFAGATREFCPGGEHQVRQGWFRLTMP